MANDCGLLGHVTSMHEGKYYIFCPEDICLSTWKRTAGACIGLCKSFMAALKTQNLF